MALTKPITFLREEVVEYQTQKKDEEGKYIVKKKTYFVSVSMSIGDFMDDLRTRTVKFISHHVDMKWQMRDWRYVKRNFPRGQRETSGAKS